MSFKKFGRFLCAVAISGAALTMPFLTGCNTDHPEAKITIEYDSVTYVLEYKMYRNMYPQTVQHFIELADNDFYTDTIIHNYQSSYWYGGGYDYVENDTLSYEDAYEEGEAGLLDYLMGKEGSGNGGASKEEEYFNLANPELGKITPSVYKDFIDGKYVQPLTTLIGEFSNNQHKIDNGALRGSFGALRMYYSSKTDHKEHVYLDKKGSAAGVMGEYRYNSATSLFSIQTSTSTSSDSSYCIFATLKNTDKLTELRSAMKNNVNTRSVSRIYIDNYDEFVDKNVNETSYTLTKKPLIVRSVEITKY